MTREESGFVDVGSTMTGQDAFLAYARIPSTGWSLAAVFPKTELLAEVNELHRTNVLLAAVALLLLLTVSLLVARSIARPLRTMALATKRVAQGELDINLSSVRSQDEVGQLAAAFVRMTEGLKERDRIRNTFGRYLTREVVNRLLESKDGLRLGGENREITMIMSDLRGFTALTTSLPPEKLLAYLNRYLGKMVDILIDYQGIIDEIIGDGILAFFGAPEPLEDHPARAVACALQMQAAMDEINALNEADGLPRLDMGIAVNTGYVVVGNIGSEKRAKYGAVGSQVNFTGRMESFTVGGQVLISSTTYERVAGLLDVRNVLEVEMKGIPGKVALYDVRGIKGEYNVTLADTADTLIVLKQAVTAQVYLLDQKVVSSAGVAARITEVSLTTAVLVLPEPVARWTDVRIIVGDDRTEQVRGEAYGKVISMTKAEDRYQMVVRFTSASPEAQKIFREAVHSS
jgi:class 3 adenylate cyclase